MVGYDGFSILQVVGFLGKTSKIPIFLPRFSNRARATTSNCTSSQSTCRCTARRRTEPFGETEVRGTYGKVLARASFGRPSCWASLKSAQKTFKGRKVCGFTVAYPWHFPQEIPSVNRIQVLPAFKYFGHHLHRSFFAFDHFWGGIPVLNYVFPVVPLWQHSTLRGHLIATSICIAHSHASLFILQYWHQKAYLWICLTTSHPKQNMASLNFINVSQHTQPHPPKTVLLQQQILLPSQSLHQHPHPTTTASPACCLEHSLRWWKMRLNRWVTWIIKYWLIMVG